VTNEQLTALLAERLLGWRVGPDRFQMGNRSWRPRGSFQPTKYMQDAFAVLLAAKPIDFRLSGGHGKPFRLSLRVANAAVTQSTRNRP
jgi:hypothetical protein